MWPAKQVIIAQYDSYCYLFKYMPILVKFENIFRLTISVPSFLHPERIMIFDKSIDSPLSQHIISYS